MQMGERSRKGMKIMVETRERSLKYSCGLMLLKSVTKHSRNFDSVAVEVAKCFLFLSCGIVCRLEVCG
jgi:hypothetical protein